MIFQTAAETRTQYQSCNVIHAVPDASTQSGLILNFIKFDIKPFSPIALSPNKRKNP